MRSRICLSSIGRAYAKAAITTLQYTPGVRFDGSCVAHSLTGIFTSATDRPRVPPAGFLNHSRTCSTHQPASIEDAEQQIGQIHEAVKQGNLWQAGQLLTQKSPQGVSAHVSPQALLDLMKGAAQQGDVEMAAVLLALLQLLGGWHADAAHGLMVRTLCSAGHLEQAVEYLRTEMPHKATNRSIYNLLLERCLKTDQAPLCLRVLDHMHGAGVRGNNDTRLLQMRIARALGDKGALEDTWQSFLNDSRFEVTLKEHRERVAAITWVVGIEAGLDALREMAKEAAGGDNDTRGFVVQAARSITMAIRERGGAGLSDKQLLHKTLLSILTDHGIDLDWPLQNHVYGVIMWTELRARATPEMIEGRLSEIVAAGVLPNQIHYNAVLYCHAREGNVDAAHAVFEQMRNNGIIPACRSYTILMMCHGAVGDVDGAHHLYRAMREEDTIVATSLAPVYAQLFNTISRWGYLTAGDIPGVEVAKDLKKGAKHIRRVGRQEAAERLDFWTEDLKRCGGPFQWDDLIALVTASGWCNDWPRISRIFCNPPEFVKACQDEQPLVAWYNAGIGAFAKCSKHFRHAMELFEEMQARGLRPDVDTYVHLMNACANNYNYRLTQKLFADMVRHDITPTLNLYTNYIKAHAWCGKLTTSIRMVDAMIREGIQPDDVLWNLLLETAKKFQARDVENALLYRRTKQQASQGRPQATPASEIRKF